MFRIGEKQVLTVEKVVRMGVFLTEKKEYVRYSKRKDSEEDVEHVLLPNSQVPESVQVGDEIEVFLYKDSEDRLIATRKEPKLKLHEVGILTVLGVSRVGAFLDWGLDKDLLLPFHEQTGEEHVREGEKVLCAVYLDKSGRLAATMNVYPYLELVSPYHKGDRVIGTAYENSCNFGCFVAVDNRYSALIPRKELVRDVKVGEQVTARVVSVRDDGKLDLSLRDGAVQMIGKDAQIIKSKMKENGGMLPFTDKADASIIRREMQMSKAQFKRAIGHLLKEGEIEIREDSIVLREK